MLETDAAIAEHAAKSICRPAAAMPCRPATSPQITPEERALLVAWFEEARQ